MVEEKIISFLTDWAKNYFQSRDAFHKNIIKIKNLRQGLKIEFKDHIESILSIHELSKLDVNSLTQPTSIITLNNRANVDTLYQKWSHFSKMAQLKIYFINPLSLSEKKWIISPQVHARICDIESLKTGLIAMFESVEPITLEILKSKL